MRRCGHIGCKKKTVGRQPCTSPRLGALVAPPLYLQEPPDPELIRRAMSLDEQEAERLFQRKRAARPDDSDSYEGEKPAASAAEVVAVDADEDFGVEVKRNAGTAAQGTHGGVLCRGVFFQTSPLSGCAEGEGSLCEVTL